MKRGATLDKPSEMMAFSLFISELGLLHLFSFSSKLLRQLIFHNQVVILPLIYQNNQ